MIGLISFVGAFLAMEVVSYATHRWVMHGFGMAWHRSHHLPAKGRVERNDLFPLCFSAVGVLLFAAASLGVPGLWWVAAGVTAYGAAYLFVHEVHIHRRLPVRVPSNRYLDWLRDAHADHHRRSGEPYGMLLPLVRDRRPSDRGPSNTTRDPLDRTPHPTLSPRPVAKPPHPPTFSPRPAAKTATRRGKNSDVRGPTPAVEQRTTVPQRTPHR